MAQREHDILQSLLMEDAIAQAPGYMHQALRDEHMHSPIKSTRELRQRLESDD